MIKQAWNKAVLNIVTIFWVLFVSVNSLLGAFVAQTYHSDFFSFSKGDQFMTIVICFWLWSGSMMALMLTIGKRIQKNESIFDEDSQNPLPVGGTTEQLETKK